MATSTASRAIPVRPPRRPLDGTGSGSPTTASRAINPRVVVRNVHLPENGFGEATLVWRCDDCGALGSLDAFPATCPACAAGREALYYDIED